MAEYLLCLRAIWQQKMVSCAPVYEMDDTTAIAVDSEDSSSVLSMDSAVFMQPCSFFCVDVLGVLL